MNKSRGKKHKAKELDLLPVMNLFSILVTVVISMATFEKLGILELWLPERSQTPTEQKQDIDEGLLNLTVIVTDKGIIVGAQGGFQPTVFYQEEVEYRSRSDQNVFRKTWVKGEEVRSPTDGKVMSPFERETIFLNTLKMDDKDSSKPGTIRYAVVNHEDNPIFDTSGNWYTEIPPVGASYRVIGDEAFRKMDDVTRRFCKITKLSAYYEVARMLEQVHKLYSNRDPAPPDVDDIVILAGEDVIYDKVIQMMDACKAAGYDRVALSLIGGEV